MANIDNGNGCNVVTGTLSGTGGSKTFMHDGANFNFTVSGTFVATYNLQRSFDAGSTWHDTTVNGTVFPELSEVCSEFWNEPEPNVWYRIYVSAWTSGTLTYRISQ